MEYKLLEQQDIKLMKHFVDDQKTGLMTQRVFLAGK